MLRFTLRRLLFAIPTLMAISFIIFALLDLAPGDPTSQLPLNIPPEVREKIRIALGMDQPFVVQYLLWLKQFCITEPSIYFAKLFELDKADAITIGIRYTRLQ